MYYITSDTSDYVALDIYLFSYFEFRVHAKNCGRKDSLQIAFR